MTPQSLNFPPFVRSFRPAQLEAVSEVLESGTRFTALGLTTGSGKSAVALMLHQLLGGRTVILTASLGLQTQYMSSFESMGLLDVRGRSNYPCWSGGTCDDGARMECKEKEGCPYFCAFRAGQQGELVETSYAMWLASGAMKLPDTLILDEATAAPEWLSRALDFHITQEEAERAGLKIESPREQHSEWMQIAPLLKLRTQANYDRVRAQRSTDLFNPMRREKTAKELRQAESLLDRVSRLILLTEDNWVITQEDRDNGRRWNFECVWPGQYRERLFRYVKRIVLMSGTLRPKTLGLLGIAKSDVTFREWGRQFPAVNGPVLHIPTTRLTYRSSAEDEQKWMNRIDEIVGLYPDRKGLIHTVSYARAKQILQRSRHRQRMVFNDREPGSESAARVFDKFKSARPGQVLVSPSFSTGWDFAGKLAEYQIIAKLPFPDSRSKVMQARLEKDKSYGSYVAAQELVQACGRIVRGEEDRGTTYIVDDQIEWFQRTAAEHLPKWFKVRREGVVPKVLEALHG